MTAVSKTNRNAFGESECRKVLISLLLLVSLVVSFFGLCYFFSCDVKKSLNQGSKEYFTNFNLCLIFFENHAIFL